ncbi:DUF2934 domain-containing protein [Amaricoccus solimangrovi]|uniref:DUF2934 domain-containing protein n=1 Tax=Amaricoccus solimangrovi TaxID=2589815 RepID=A0A501WZS0_9RHOB|nr:DUF2934 domain-containing protein [Amaricoccus solimangrovi]TPE51656.1 DUF2934 domain-containing protein [Amaricoccus solimangrovi]
MDQELEDRVRSRAYAIWEEEGRPEGADLDHWLRAVLELQAEEAGGPASGAQAGGGHTNDPVTVPEDMDPGRLP